jgi:hypothetical protein
MRRSYNDGTRLAVRGLRPFLWIAGALLALLAARYWTEIMGAIRNWNLKPFVDDMFRR